jgi:hypothetical protein
MRNEKKNLIKTGIRSCRKKKVEVFLWTATKAEGEGGGGVRKKKKATTTKKSAKKS